MKCLFFAGTLIKITNIDFNACVQENTRFTSEDIGMVSQTWKPLENGYCKINVVVAFTPNKRTSGDIVQYHMRVFLGCETITFNATSV